MNARRWLRVTTLPTMVVCWLAVAPTVYADEPIQGSGTTTISFVPVPERTADGNTFYDYTFVEHLLGIFNGTRVGSGSFVLHSDGSLETQNSGIFYGTVAGRSGTAEMSFRGSGTFASAGGNYVVTHGTGGLSGVHAEGTDSGAATGPTTFAATYSMKVHFTTP